MIGHFHIKFPKETTEIIKETLDEINKGLQQATWHDIKNIKLYKDGLIVIEIELFNEDDE